jgi:hypothetical protein
MTLYTRLAILTSAWIMGVALFLPGPTAAASTADDAAKALLAQAVARRNNADFEASLKLLKRAAHRAQDPGLSVRIQLHQGITLAIMERTVEAEDAFRAALRRDPLVSLPSTGLKRAIVEIFGAVRLSVRGALELTADRPGVEVLIDGALAGLTPLSTKLPVGRHVVEVRLSGRLAADGAKIGPMKRWSVVISSRRPVRRSARLARVPRPRSKGRLWTWIAAGAAGAALGAGIGLGVSAEADHTEYMDPGTGPARGSDLEGRIDTKATVANVMFVTAGGLALTAVVLFFLEGRGEEAAAGGTTVAAPGFVLTRGGGLAALTASF